ncbi:hypothetical protein [Halorarum halobium]|uniref:hypothetical protein n=1 Tax=Halorarum halobium TaxID=3075121 RepID=UPI0028A6116C|nr:hypothetical protein [Halobaculum sp. XH14]
MPPDTPPVPVERLAEGDWRELERAAWRPFDVGLLAVDATRVVYEDATLRNRIRESTGIDGSWRFFLAARLELSPTPPGSRALTALVTDRALSGFVDVLAERGFADVRRAASWDEPATRPVAEQGDDREPSDAPVEYVARCTVDGVSLRATALALVRPVEGGYVLAGGAYPTGVRDAPDGVGADAIERELDPARFRSELLALVRATC